MKRHALLATLALAAAAVACGETEKTLPGGEGGTPVVDPNPQFGGIDEVLKDGLDGVRIRWKPATDDVTLPENLVYTIHHWQAHPDRHDEALSRPKTYERSCVEPSCEYKLGNVLVTDNVQWFAVTVADEDGNEVGLDRILPKVRASGPPAIGEVLYDGEPATTVPVGGTLVVRGERFLDEPTDDEAIHLGDLPVPMEFVESWGNYEIVFDVPDGFAGGAIRVVTPEGESSSAAIVVGG